MKGSGRRKKEQFVLLVAVLPENCVRTEKSEARLITMNDS